MPTSLRLATCSLAALAFALATVTTSTARADKVLVDFGSDSSFRGISVASPDANGNTWNSLQPGLLYTGLLNTAGTATTLNLGFSTPVATDSYNGPAGATSFPKPNQSQLDAASAAVNLAALGDLGVPQAIIDYAAGPGFPSVTGVTGNVVRFEIQGLDPTQHYDLRFYGAHEFATDSTTVYTVFSDNTYTTPVASGSLLVQDPNSPWMPNPSTTVDLDNLAPQTDNIFYVQFVGLESGSDGYLNALEISTSAAAPLPEPAAISVLSLPAIALLRRRR